MISDCWEGWDEEAWTDCWGAGSALLPPYSLELTVAPLYSIELSTAPYFDLGLEVQN